MPIYRVVWDYTEIIEFESDKVLSEEEFKALVNSIIREWFRQRMEQKPQSWIGFCKWDKIEEFLIKELGKRGFRLVEPLAVAEYWGLFVPTGDEDREELSELLGDELADAVIRHNKELHEKYLKAISSR